MPIKQIHQFVEIIASVLELAGVAIIVGGTILAFWLYARGGMRSRDWRGAYTRFRSNLGRGILLGLELLVGADIIATITSPLTFDNVALLALVILIRTFLSFALETEIEGCWPWQRAELKRRTADADEER